MILIVAGDFMRTFYVMCLCRFSLGILTSSLLKRYILSKPLRLHNLVTLFGTTLSQKKCFRFTDDCDITQADQSTFNVS